MATTPCSQRQQLNVRIQIAAQIEDHPLFKRVVEQDAQRVESVLNKKGAGREHYQWQQFVRSVRAHDVVNDPFRCRWENNHHQRAQDGTNHGARSHPRIPLQISKNAPDRFHCALNLNACVTTSR